MPEHDEFCPVRERGPKVGTCTWCDVLDRARADERAREKAEADLAITFWEQSLNTARAEVAALRELHNLGCGKVLADLSAKVEGLRSVQSMSDDWPIMADPATIRAVLALIEQVSRG